MLIGLDSLKKNNQKAISADPTEGFWGTLGRKDENAFDPLTFICPELFLTLSHFIIFFSPIKTEANSEAASIWNKNTFQNVGISLPLSELSFIPFVFLLLASEQASCLWKEKGDARCLHSVANVLHFTPCTIFAFLLFCLMNSPLCGVSVHCDWGAVAVFFLSLRFCPQKVACSA